MNHARLSLSKIHYKSAAKTTAPSPFRSDNFVEAIKIYKELKMFKNVRECYESIIEDTPDLPDVRVEFAEHLKDIGLYDESRK